MSDGDLRARLAALLRFAPQATAPEVQTLGRRAADGYAEHHVEYAGHAGARVPAFLLLPDGPGPVPAVVAHHQPHGRFHLGKSEVAGRAGDPLQAFGPALARRGVAVLAPDAVGFEDRHATGPGVEPAAGGGA